MSVNVDSSRNEADFETIFEKIQPPPMFVLLQAFYTVQLTTYCRLAANHLN
jgi:hypothetical protein